MLKEPKSLRASERPNAPKHLNYSSPGLIETKYVSYFLDISCVRWRLMRQLSRRSISDLCAPLAGSGTVNNLLLPSFIRYV